MVRLDLRAAGIAFAVQTPNGVEVRDFHAFRCTFISTVLASGADLKQAMTLARHTDPRLTTQAYARTDFEGLADVVNRSSPDRIPLVPVLVPPSDSDGGQSRPIEESCTVQKRKRKSSQKASMVAIYDDLESSEMDEDQSRLRDLNSRPPLYESGALPLS